MKAFAASVVAVLVIAIAASFVLDRQQVTVADTFSTEGARIDAPARWQ